MIDLSGKKALITGSSRGIGKIIANTFSKYGADVIGISSTECNLESPKDIELFLNNHILNVDIVIHSAGINELAGIENVTQEMVEKVLQINVFSFISILKILMPYMIVSGYGRIIGISSLYGIVSKAGRLPYSTSKNALTGVIKSVALEMASKNILINGVAPGFVMTEMTKNNMTEYELKDIVKEIPTGRLQDGKEIADLCAFLCSSMNQSITGQIIPVDGGFLCK